MGKREGAGSMALVWSVGLGIVRAESMRRGRVGRVESMEGKRVENGAAWWRKRWAGERQGRR